MALANASDIPLGFSVTNDNYLSALHRFYFRQN